MKFIAAAQECAHGPHVAGPDAALLGRLCQVPGLEIAPWLAVLPAALPASLNPWQAQAYAKVRRGADLAELVGKIHFSPPVLRELEKALRGLGAESVDLVLAGATGTEHPHVPTERAPARLLDLWQGAARALGDGIAPEELPAIVVRVSRPADASCRTLSFDPASPGRRRTTLFALPGRRAGVGAPADRFILEDDGTLVQAQKAAKLRAFFPAAAGGLEARPVPADLASEAAIDGTQLRELAALTRRASEQAGKPVQLDWVIEGGHLQLVAARAEVLPDAVPGEDRTAVRWDAAPAERWLSGAVSPLGFSVTCRWLAVAEAHPAGDWARLDGGIRVRAGAATIEPTPPPPREDWRAAALALGAEAATGDAPALAESWLRLESVSAELAAATRASVGAAEAAVSALADACEKCLGDRPTALALIAPATGSPAAKFAAEFQRHGHEIHHDDELVRVLAEGSATAQGQALEAAGERGRAVRQWAAGTHPFPGEAGTDAPSFAVDPSPLLRALGVFALGFWRAPYRPPSNGCTEIVQRAELAVEQKLAGLAAAPRRWSVQRAIKEARAALGALEVLESASRAAADARRTLLAALGRALRADGALAAAGDVSLLRIDELIGWLRGNGVDADLPALADLRRAAPGVPALTDRFVETGAMVLRAPPRSGPPAAAWQIGGSRRGVAAGLGSASGPVCLLRNGRSDFVQQGAILVARAAEPGWAMHLPAASALVLEHGSLVDPIPRLARHLGLPVVLGLEGATDALTDDSWLTVDGTAGTVQRIEEVAPRAEGEVVPTPATGSIRLPPSRFGVQKR